MTSRLTSPDIEKSQDGFHPLELKHDAGVRDLTFDTAVTDLPHHPSVSFPDLSSYQNPFQWSSARKISCLVLSCGATFIAAYSAGAYSIGAESLRAQFNISSTAFQTGVTTWCAGFACSPMFLAPLSEINGRRPVFLFSGFLFFVSLIGCAVTESFAGMLVARFFVGAGASTFATMVGGVVSDVFHAKDRNTPMAIYSASALAGTGVGPLCCGFIVPRTTWRWVFWHQVISLGTVMLLMLIFFQETRGSVLLSRKAAKINKYLDAIDAANTCPSPADNPTTLPSAPAPAPAPATFRYRVPTDASKSNIRYMLYLSLTTPFKLLFSEPVVFFFSLWAGFAWGVLYMQLNVLPLVFRTSYSFNTEQVGASFTSLVVGTILALLLSIFQEKLARRYFPRLLSDGPEGRLYFACLEAALLPIGLFWFGWTSSPHIPWIVPCLGATAAMMGIFSIYLAVFNYLADVYHRYASSALACQSFCRNILAAVFPLFSERMFTRLTFPAASSLLGGLAAVLTIVPWVLVFKGPKIRARSRIASQGMVL